MTDRAPLAALLGAIDANSAGFTLCEISAGIGLLGTAFDGVTAYQVLSGTLHMGGVASAPVIAGEGWLVLVPGGVRPVLAADAAGVDAKPVDGERCFGRSSRGWMVADATRDGRRDLVLAAARITGTGKVSLAEPAALPVGHSSAGRHAVTLLRDEFARSEGSPALAASLMGACITLGLRGAIEGDASAPVPVRPDHRRERIARAVSAIAARPADPHSVESLASLAGMSRATFVRQFARLMGTSPIDYLQRRRLREAAAMLRSTRLPVKAVAASAGFVSGSHFSRAFSAAYGQDPSSFRAADRSPQGVPDGASPPGGGRAVGHA